MKHSAIALLSATLFLTGCCTTGKCPLGFGSCKSCASAPIPQATGTIAAKPAVRTDSAVMPASHSAAQPSKPVMPIAKRPAMAPASPEMLMPEGEPSAMAVPPPPKGVALDRDAHLPAPRDLVVSADGDYTPIAERYPEKTESTDDSRFETPPPVDTASKSAPSEWSAPPVKRSTPRPTVGLSN